MAIDVIRPKKLLPLLTSLHFYFVTGGQIVVRDALLHQVLREQVVA